MKRANDLKNIFFQNHFNALTLKSFQCTNTMTMRADSALHVLLRTNILKSDIFEMFSAMVLELCIAYSTKYMQF